MPLEQNRMKPPQDMTPEELRITVAEIMGAKWYRNNKEAFSLLTFEEVNPAQWTFMKGAFPGDNQIISEYVPAYSTSLDAMAQAEGTLNHNDIGEYLDNLEKVCVPVHICPTTHAFSLIHATANERAIAFVQTMRKE